MTDNAGPLLLRAGLITQAQLKSAYLDLARSGGTLTEYLVASKLVDEERLCNFFRERLLVPRVGLADLQRVSRRTANILPADMAAEFRAVPLEVDAEQNLALAMADPSDTHALDEIQFFTGHSIFRVCAPPTAIAWALKYFYGIATPLGETVMAGLPLPLPAPQGPAAAPAPEPAPVPVAAPPVPTPARPKTPSKPPALIVPTPAAVPAEMAPVAAASGPRRLPQALIVEDIFDQETPLPKPVPFDETTGRVFLVDPSALHLASVSAAPVAPSAPPPGATPVPPPAAAPTPAPAAPAGEATLTIETGAPSLVQAFLPTSPETHPEADAALDDARLALADASDRDTVALALVGFVRHLARRAAFFVVRKGELGGWLGSGIGIHLDTLRSATLALEKPSTFRDVVRARLSFRGPVTDPLSRDFLIEGLGWAPVDMIACPISVRGRVVGVLYGDERIHVLPDEHLIQITLAAEQALERALLSKKSHG